LIDEAGYGDVRFRITVPRQQPGQLIISMEPFKPLPQEYFKQGVRCISVPGAARHNPAVKSTDWMHNRQKIADSMPSGIYDALLLDDNGDLLEGLASNFYAILNGELRTAGSGVLPGIAQQIVFEVVPSIMSIRREAVNVAEIPQLEEAFITSSSRGIVPVVEIDGHVLGDGTPGPQTTALHRAYNAWVTNHLEEL
jgi:branched-chain amino acid aminotransferase